MELKIWFLDVGHGDCAYIQLPNGARMMIDCGCGTDHWPSKMLKSYGITADSNPVAIPDIKKKYGIDNLVITHPHGDHIADIAAIHDDIGFYMLTGGYSDFIDDIEIEKIDFRKRGKDAAEKFKKVVEKYSGNYVKERDRVASANPPCIVSQRRFIAYEKGMTLNDLSYFVSFQIGNHKMLFSGDMTSKGVNSILSNKKKADNFKSFVRGTTILKIPHHGREDGCSQEMFDAFGNPPLLCIASDEALNERNETSDIKWYSDRTNDTKIMIDDELKDRKVLTTRKDKDIFLGISENGQLRISTNCFGDKKQGILKDMSV